jgi:hypothetical protein
VKRASAISPSRFGKFWRLGKCLARRIAIAGSRFGAIAMINGWMKIGIQRWWMAGLVSGWLVLLAPFTFAQNTEPPPSASSPAQPQPGQKPGLLEAIGRWFDQGAADIRSHMGDAKQKIDALNDEAAANSKNFGDKAAEVTKGAVDAVTKLPPVARVMSGRENCVTAPNGAPDCLAAAEALCRKHGYSTGKSMDFTSAEECPTRVLLGQQTRAECTTVTFISRALCQ